MNSKTQKRRISENGQRWVVVFEALVAIVLIVLSFVTSGVVSEDRLFGITVYCALPILTWVLISVPIAFQRTAAVMTVLLMIAVSFFLPIPPGFGWIVPVYFLKLLMGFTAREQTGPATT